MRIFRTSNIKKSKWHPRRQILLLLLFMVVSLSLAAQNINITGENTATYIYRTAKDSLNNYLENELKFRVDRGVFSFGMSFLAELPKYDDTAPVSELHSDNLKTSWKDLFVQLNYDDFRLKAGTIDEAYGVGLILRSWNNPDLDQDKRLDGALAHYNYKNLRLKGLYGKMKEDIRAEAISQNDLVTAIDSEYKVFPFLAIGASAVEYKQERSLIPTRDYTYLNIYGGRFALTTDYFDLESEYAEHKTFHGLPSEVYGNALYSYANGYLGSWSLGAGYKRYDNFDRYPLSDLPTLNHYDELLYSYATGYIKTEEGLFGEIRYNHNLQHEILVNYGESWDDKYDVRLANIFAEYKWHLDAVSITTDFEHLEKRNNYIYSWEKEVIPTISIDFLELPVPLTVKAKWSFKEENIYETEKSYNKPYLQIDSRLFGILKYAIFAEYQFVGMDDISNNKVYLGAELVTNIASHTEAKLFAGQEKGGKVCRNGICKDQAPFEGIKFSLNTRF